MKTMHVAASLSFAIAALQPMAAIASCESLGQDEARLTRRIFSTQRELNFANSRSREEEMRTRKKYIKEEEGTIQQLLEKKTGAYKDEIKLIKEDIAANERAISKHADEVAALLKTIQKEQKELGDIQNRERKESCDKKPEPSKCPPSTRKPGELGGGTCR